MKRTRYEMRLLGQIMIVGGEIIAIFLRGKLVMAFRSTGYFAHEAQHGLHTCAAATLAVCDRVAKDYFWGSGPFV